MHDCTDELPPLQCWLEMDSSSFLSRRWTRCYEFAITSHWENALHSSHLIMHVCNDKLPAVQCWLEMDSSSFLSRRWTTWYQIRELVVTVQWENAFHSSYFIVHGCSDELPPLQCWLEMDSSSFLSRRWTRCYEFAITSHWENALHSSHLIMHVCNDKLPAVQCWLEMDSSSFLQRRWTR